jgi:cyanophycinase
MKHSQRQTTLAIVTLVIILAGLLQTTAQPEPQASAKTSLLTKGPAHGSLVIMGGGSGKGSEEIYKRFVDLAGGPSANIIVVTTAGSSDPNHNYLKTRLVDRFHTEYQAEAVSILHTHDRETADTDEFVEPLRKATGVWFTGGRQWRLTKAYKRTRTEKEFHALLSRGGVVGGSSAGATIQGSFLARGDTSSSKIMIGDHQHGFGFLSQAAIDQHLFARKRQFDMIEILEDPNQKLWIEFDRKLLLGIGIDESTALVVTGNVAEVIGAPSGKVLIYDPRLWTANTPKTEKYITLNHGDEFDLNKRARLLRNSKQTKPRE